MENQKVVIRDFPNRYPGTCASCKTKVDAGAGRCFRQGGTGRYLTCCASLHCGQKLCLKSAVAPTVPQVDTEGYVTFDLDDSSKGMLKAAGARWDFDRKQYRLDLTTLPMLQRAIEVSKKLSLQGVEILEAFYGPMREKLDREVEQARGRAIEVGAYPYQVEGVAWLAGCDRGLLGDDMGLGKTLQLLVALPDQARALVVAPKSLTMNWQVECAKWRKDLTSARAAKWQELRAPKDGEVLITHYECLRAHANAVAKGKAEALDFRGVTLIADEAHRTKSYKAALTKAFRAVGEQADRVWIATGTPLLGKPLDLWGVLQSGGLGALAFDGGFSGFKRAFDAYEGRYGLEWGAPDPEIVPASLARVMLRRTKTEALPGLPGKVYVNLTVNGLSKTLVKQMDKMAEAHEELLESGTMPSFEEMANIRRKLAESRIPAAMEWCDDRKDAGEPVIVFSSHRKPVETLGARENWAAILGDTPVARRQEIVEQFQAGKLEGVALTIGAGREGLTLTAASTVLFVDMDWTPALNLQAEDRICRIGQRADRCTVVRMVSSHALDQRVLELLTKKMALINSTVEAARDAEALERPEIGEYEPAEREADIWTPETEAEWEARVTEMKRTKDRQEREKLMEIARGKTSAVVSRRDLQPREFTADQVRAMEEGLMLLSNVCDGAQDQDGVGFNKIDTAYGKWLALTGLLDAEAKLLAYDILRKYQGQLGAGLYQQIYGS